MDFKREHSPNASVHRGNRGASSTLAFVRLSLMPPAQTYRCSQWLARLGRNSDDTSAGTEQAQPRRRNTPSGHHARSAGSPFDLRDITEVRKPLASLNDYSRMGVVQTSWPPTSRVAGSSTARQEPPTHPNRNRAQRKPVQGPQRASEARGGSARPNGTSREGNSGTRRGMDRLSL